MKVRVSGIGIWSKDARNWYEFERLINDRAADPGQEWSAPAPIQIPKRERRRAPLIVRLSVEVAHQACDMSSVQRDDLATVFASAMGDTNITDYMCRTLASMNKILSPTRFHNSVHNAPAGYWSISTGNRAPSSSIACSEHSFPVGLLEATVQSTVESRPVLLVMADIGLEPPLSELYPIREAFGAALVLQTQEDEQEGVVLSVEYCESPAHWPEIRDARLGNLYDSNPSARCLGLLEAIASGDSTNLEFPLGKSTSLRVGLS